MRTCLLIFNKKYCVVSFVLSINVNEWIKQHIACFMRRANVIGAHNSIIRNDGNKWFTIVVI